MTINNVVQQKTYQKLNKHFNLEIKDIKTYALIIFFSVSTK